MAALAALAALETRAAAATDRSDRLKKLLIAFAWLGVAGLLAARALRRGVSSDFGFYWYAAQAAADGQPLYQGEAAWHGWYLYSPTFSVLFRPLLGLPMEWAYASWIAASLAALFASAWLLERAVARAPGLRVFPGLGLLALVILTVPTASNFRWGNSNAFMMLLVTIAFACLIARRPLWTGFALSLASVIKLTPLVFLVWIVVRREWHALAGFGLGTLLWLALLPAVVLGPSYAAQETKAWVQAIVLPAVQGSAPLEDAYSSLPRVAERLFSAEPGAAATPAGAELPLDLVLLVGWLPAALLLALTAACAAKELRVGAISFCLMGVAMLLAAPAARSAQFMQIYPLVGLLLACAASGAQPIARRARWGLAGAVSCMLLLFVCARLVGVSSKEFFPITALAFVLWSTGVLIVLRARASGLDERGAG